jgi:hypothetical protein
MGNGTSIGNFGSLTTTGEGVRFDGGALGGNPKALIGSPDALSANPETLSCDPDALRFDPDALSRDTEALSCDPGTLSFDTEALSFDAETLSFDVFHQRRSSNGLISSNLRGIASKPSKFGSFSQTLNPQPSTLN